MKIENILMVFCLTILLIGVMISFAHAESDWTKEDTVYQVLFSSLLMTDWLQTKEAVSEGYKENNPILGSYPSQNSIDVFGASVIIGHFAISKLLPKDWRRKWQLLTIGAEIKNVAHNYNIGVRIRF